MTTIKAFMKKHPVLCYFILTFTISWGGIVILVGGPAGITAEQTDKPFMPLYLMTVAGPSLASLFLTAFIYGKAGLREIGSRLLKWRVGASWYAAALLIAPLSVMAALFALSLTSTAFLPGLIDAGGPASTLPLGFSAGNRLPFVLFVLVLGLVNGMIEELGWTGFAIPKMKLSGGFVATGLTVGLLWGAWHFVSNYLGSAASAGSMSLALYMAAMLFTFLPPYRVLMVWVYSHTQSLLVAVLMHASLDVFWLISMPLAITGEQRAIWYLVWAGVLWVIVAAVALAGQRQPERVSRHTQAA